MEKQYLRYQGESQIKNTDTGDRGRQRQTSITWGAPRTLRERKDWGKTIGPRRNGEPVSDRTYSDCRRREYERRELPEDEKAGVIKNRLHREVRRENVLLWEDKRNARSAISLYTKSALPNSHSKGKKGVGQQKQRTKVTRAMSQQCWGRGESQRRDGRGQRKVGNRSVRTEVSQAEGLCSEQINKE